MLYRPVLNRHSLVKKHSHHNSLETGIERGSVTTSPRWLHILKHLRPFVPPTRQKAKPLTATSTRTRGKIRATNYLSKLQSQSAANASCLTAKIPSTVLQPYSSTCTLTSLLVPALVNFDSSISLMAMLPPQTLLCQRRDSLAAHPRLPL